MQINPKTGKPFGYHVKGKQTLTEFCVAEGLKLCIYFRENCVEGLEQDYKLLAHFEPIKNEYPLVVKNLNINITYLEMKIKEYTEKIAFYNWMLH